MIDPNHPSIILNEEEGNDKVRKRKAHPSTATTYETSSSSSSSNNKNNIQPQRKLTKLRHASNDYTLIHFPEQVGKVESITWLVKEGQCILAYEPLGKVVYTLMNGNREAMTIVSNAPGKVEQLLRLDKPASSSPNQLSEPQRIFLKVYNCNHPETWKELCARCNGSCSSLYMRKKLSGEPVKFIYDMATQFNFPIPEMNGHDEKKPTQKSHVSLLHKLGYTIDFDQAIEIDRQNQRRLIEKKKLSLVLDLDHTLLHTINDFEYSREGNRSKPFREVYDSSELLQKHIHRFFMRGTFHFVKFRPRLDEFLRRCSNLFEMHVFTHGERQYADQIGSMLDPKRELFADRILSRDECPDINTKTLSNVFPCSDKSVLVIDDKTDVWKNNADNVIQIAPYDYFRRIFGVQLDVNNAPGNDADRKQLMPSAQPPRPVNYKIIENTIDDYEEDDQLDVVYNLLEKVHTEYFKDLTSNEDVDNKDVKIILKEKKKDILRGKHIVFSGVIPLQQDPKQHPAWRIAQDLGATCYTDISPNVTHLVAGRKGTEKVRKIEQMPGVHIVHESWLYACMKYLKKQNEFDYQIMDVKHYPISENYPKSKKEIAKFQQVCADFVDYIQQEASELARMQEEETVKELEADLFGDAEAESEDSSSSESDSE
ncbi:hypothetical protein FDP41_007402 [Naegleria fowleri]|uniref:RNA polymerase II subunit A C-terminal domain phosphatase n=1 Tax=Naegleria fowleri TaxID=5763 RepID=A0A6A5CG38_NAEFO|nr:uncharacterized protein FDP41_007402 [Naegleria fowleri]KAF0984225.1 hypothetical protein FDP41_007402 [Naegleria fowleri]CAG4708360.1 unnamed protein product [Naegleria fowleri]